jgi:hypothetical protein
MTTSYNENEGTEKFEAVWTSSWIAFVTAMVVLAIMYGGGGG